MRAQARARRRFGGIGPSFTASCRASAHASLDPPLRAYHWHTMARTTAMKNELRFGSPPCSLRGLRAKQAHKNSDMGWMLLILSPIADALES